MIVFFKKSNPKNYIIYPVPTNLDDYHAVEINDEQDLEGKVLVEYQGRAELVNKPINDTYVWNGSEWVVDEEKLVKLKAQKIEQLKTQINALRDEKSTGGCYVESLGKWFDSDQAAYNNLLGFKAETDLNGEKTTYWACADNSLIEFDREKLKTVISTLWDVKTPNHATALKHKAMLEQAENPEDYDYSTGWVKSYADFVKEQTNDV